MIGTSVMGEAARQRFLEEAAQHPVGTLDYVLVVIASVVLVGGMGLVIAIRRKKER